MGLSAWAWILTSNFCGFKCEESREDKFYKSRIRFPCWYCHLEGLKSTLRLPGHLESTELDLRAGSTGSGGGEGTQEEEHVPGKLTRESQGEIQSPRGTQCSWCCLQRHLLVIFGMMPLRNGSHKGAGGWGTCSEAGYHKLKKRPRFAWDTRPCSF